MSDGGRANTANAIGDFVAWDGGCLFIGGPTSVVVPMHAHYAIQLAFGSTPGIRFRASEREEWVEYEGVAIASRQPHSMDSTTVPFSAVMFVEPETHEGRALDRRFGAAGIASLAADEVRAVAAPLFHAWSEQRDEAAVVDASRAAVRALTGGVTPLTVSDERILRAVAYVKQHIDGPLTLEEVAAEACLSPSRFRHLFVEQTGTGLRPYVLWRRFLRVWELLGAGETLSAAAHGAGFADAAHLSRTSRQMFGLPPSLLNARGLLQQERRPATPSLPSTLDRPPATTRR